MLRSARQSLLKFSPRKTVNQQRAASDFTDAVVVGAGVVGLAVARELGKRGLETVILESERQIGSSTSSRSSEVIHSGIYYPTGSNKAKSCLDGAAKLYEFCKTFGVPHKQLGKLIVATSETEAEQLPVLKEKGEANGVTGISLLDAAASKQLEPHIRCAAALHVPSTGIIDSHSYMLALLADAEAHGVALALQSTLLAGYFEGGRKVLSVRDGSTGDTSSLACECMVNCAGLSAQAVARSLGFMPPSLIPEQYLARGHYFTMSGSVPFSRLIYPLPEPGGLGVHLTLDMGGQARFGPDVQWVSAVEYDIPPGRETAFYSAIQKYHPALQEGALQPSYSGIRPKISGPGQPSADFMLQGPAQHGVQGFVNMFGIESPGLTASLSLAEQAVQALSAQAA